MSGTLSFTSGTASGGNSGQIRLATGSATNGEGGDIIVSVGKSKTDAGGVVWVTAGHSESFSGGAVSLTTGEGSTDTSGAVVIKTMNAGTTGVEVVCCLSLQAQPAVGHQVISTCSLGVPPMAREETSCFPLAQAQNILEVILCLQQVCRLHLLTGQEVL